MKRKLIIILILIILLAAGYFLIVKKPKSPQPSEDKTASEDSRPKITNFDGNDYLDEALLNLEDLEKLMLQ